MTNTPQGPIKVDTDLVRQLAELLDQTQLTEIEVQDGDRRIKVARKLHVAGVPVPVPAPASPAQAAAAPAGTSPPTSPIGHANAIRSPMVGTAFLAAEPGAPNFVSPGTKVNAGDTLLIIEAMKVMNPIIAPHAGTVGEVLITNGAPVEFDQPLIVIE